MEASGRMGMDPDEKELVKTMVKERRQGTRGPKKVVRREAPPSPRVISQGEGCAFSWEKLVEMKDQKTEFFAGDGFKRIRILDIDEKTRNIHMICELGKKTWPLNFAKLEELHTLLHEGKVRFIPYEIDRFLPTWGNFVAGLFKYLGCDQGD